MLSTCYLHVISINEQHSKTKKLLQINIKNDEMNFNGSHRFNRSLKIHIYIDVRRKYIEVDIYIHIKTKHTNDTK